jgi:pimeloyl-ACP methyl ester carboxylesterase
VLLGGGLDGEPWELLPEVDVFNFAPRCRVPMLMINGRDDFLMPLDPTQRMLFRLLGAPEAHKRHALLAGGHLPSDLTGVIKETLAWLDRELGPVPGPPVAR